MTHRNRGDGPFQLHHITNRAAHGEVIFANRWDYRYFIALIL